MFLNNPSEIENGEIIDRNISSWEVGKSVVAGSQDSFAFAKIFNNDFVLKRANQNLDTYAIGFTLKGFFKELLSVLDYIRDSFFQGSLPFQVSMFSGELAKLENDNLFILVLSTHTEYYCHVFGERSVCEELKSKLGKDETRVRMSWWFKDSDGHMDERDLDFRFSQETKDEYYPNLPNGVVDYLNRFYMSKSPVLVLMGEPGTGKTSFIKTFIKQFALNTTVTYDEEIMASDYFYCEFLTNQRQALLVIEDADVLLSSRERTENKTMSKILNVSDGLVTLEGKKIIFTTNLQNLNHVDEALIRPGRCFDVLNFERLTFEQARNACLAASLNPVDDNRKYTLSEVFNRDKHSYYTNRKIGF